MSKLIGIDYGTKRVGIAMSDEGGEMAFPNAVLPNDEFLITKIKKIYNEEGAQGIVMGESKDYKGKPNLIMKDSLELKDALEKELDTEVHLEPEFMTSMQAAHPLRRTRGGDEHAHSKGETLDASAAAIILQSFLDKKRNINI